MVGAFLKYIMEIYFTILVDLGDLTSMQAKATGKTYQGVVWLLNYATYHPIYIFHNKASYIILQIHVNALYLSVSHNHIQDSGCHY